MGGGKIFYVTSEGFTVQGYGNTGDPDYFVAYTAHYLEAAPYTTENTAQWGTYGSFVGSSIDYLGYGRKNTQMIVNFLKNMTVPEIKRAAQLCDSLIEGGKDDWFLPSSDELNYMYENLRKTVDLDNFGGKVYWSSSEYNSSWVWFQYFGDGRRTGYAPHFYDKDNTYSVRAIRAF